MVDQSIIEKVKLYLDFLRNKNIPVSSAYLYGSYARGEGNNDSDIDVMLISDAFDNYTSKEKGKIWGYTYQFDYRIEPYIVGKKRFLTDDVSPIILIVKQE